jgi:2-oxoisovalerate dehydrogenase E1 component
MRESAVQAHLDAQLDWKRIAYHALCSRALDRLEVTKLVPAKKVLYQFSAGGHDVAQVILGSLLTHPHDAASAYYRCRPLLLALGLSLEDAVAAPLARSGGFSNGRDIGVVCNMPRGPGACVLPMSGAVGSQYTPGAGWAQAITYRRDVLGEKTYAGAIAVAIGGEASVATNGFWSALTMATTLQLPMLFYIEDNGYGISVPGRFQTPGGDIAKNLASFTNLTTLDGDGTEPELASRLIEQAVGTVRAGRGPVLLRLELPRLSGHSGQDTQTYKSAELIAAERARDPLPRLERFLVPARVSRSDWDALAARAERDLEAALERALARPEPDPATVTQYVMCERDADGAPIVQQRGGLTPEGHVFPASSDTPAPEPARMNMLTAIRRTLEHELASNPKLLVFGLQEKFGEGRVFDTSLSEEGIIGRAVGMALAGLMPVPEIQFRKYADPATEQLNDCGTIRWRTANRYAAPIVVRMPGGFFKCGDPWHSQCAEVQWAHAIGWRLAFPSNAEDAVGLLRAALRGNDPTIFFEHRSLLDGAWARRPYPGDDYLLPFGRAKLLREGDALSVVTWGAMCERCEAAADAVGADIEILDLRTLAPWDEAAVLASVRKTRRCLIVHEDTLTAGFGAEIAAVLAQRAFFDLDAPIERMTMPDVPSPHNVHLLERVVPSAEGIAAKMREIIAA